MNKREVEAQREANASKGELSEFQMRSLDIDIAFYGTKLQKTEKT